MSEEEKTDEQEEKLEWINVKKLNIWDERRKYKQALEELFDGSVRYLKFIKMRMGEQAAKDGFQITVDFTFEKNMGGLVKLGAAFLKAISKKILLKKIVTSFFVNMQHVVELNCIKKLAFNPDSTEIIIEKCTGKHAWKSGLKNTNATELFGQDDYCNYSCIPSFQKFLEVADAQSTVELQKRGCHHIIKFK